MARRGRDVRDEPVEQPAAEDDELEDEYAEDEEGDDGEEYDEDEYDDEDLEYDDEDTDEYDDEELAEDEDDPGHDAPRHGGNGALPPATAVEAIRVAMRMVTQLTGRAAEGVVSMAPAEGGGWSVGVEVVETRRIPDSADILAVYEATVDGDLELTGFRRTRRYSRGQVDAR